MAVSNEDMLAMARTMPIPVPWDRNVFVENIARLRGRPIQLIPTETAVLADSPCGLWLKRETDDVILHEIGTSNYHIDQIVCHEIGHMVLEHAGSPGGSDDVPGRIEKLRNILLPDLDLNIVQAVFGRKNYGGDQERDAEMFASMVMIAAAEAAQRHSMIQHAFFRRE